MKCEDYMEILQLKYFYALANTEHVTKTAQQLHVAQPALTQTIHRLEKELGVKLFCQSGRNIVLTEYGRHLQRRIEPVLKTLNEIPEELQQMAGERQKLLKINVLAASNLITDTIIQFQKSHKDIRFHIVQNSEEEDADITVFTEECFRYPHSTRDAFYVFSEEIFLAVPKNSSYAQREQIRLNEMSGKRFISLAGFRGLRSICDRFCMQAGFRPDVVFESDSPSAVIKLIGASLGVGFWPQYTWEKPDDSEMTLLPVSEPSCRRDIVVVLHDRQDENTEARAYFEYLTEYFNGLKS